MGDILVFRWQGSAIFKRVVAITKRDDFRSLLKYEGVRACLPHLRDGDIELGVNMYHSFRGYKDLEEEHKVRAKIN